MRAIRSKELIPTEHQEQCTVIAWAEVMKPKFPELAYLYACPNGGKRHVVAAMKMKQEGVKAGVPDLFLPVQKSFSSGLYIEMKRKGGVISPDQERWILFLRSQNFRVVVCWSADEAIRELELYLEVR